MEVTSELDRDVDEENTIAEGYHEAGDRRVEVEYSRIEGGVAVDFAYFEDGEQVAEADGSVTVRDGEISGGFWHGQSVDQFIGNHFNADPEAELGEIFDDVVDRHA
jgi:hypothetical protein